MQTIKKQSGNASLPKEERGSRTRCHFVLPPWCLYPSYFSLTYFPPSFPAFPIDPRLPEAVRHHHKARTPQAKDDLLKAINNPSRTTAFAALYFTFTIYRGPRFPGGKSMKRPSVVFMEKFPDGKEGNNQNGII